MFLGIDQGTTGSTAILISEKGKTLGRFTSAVPQHFPKPGWVEHHPEEIWSSVAKSVLGVLKETKKKASAIQGIGITNQRETVSLFKKNKPLHRFIVWQDRRTADLCEKLKSKKNHIHEISGLPIDPYFSATKIFWLKKKLGLSNNAPVTFRTIESFLIERMTGRNITEITNASRTSLLDLKKLKWSESLFNYFDIPRAWAPEVVTSEGLEIKTKNCDFLPDGIPICAALGDQQAALFGQCGWKPGAGKITFGTGSFILLNTGQKPVFSKHQMVSTVALQWKNKEALYALEGSAFNCGSWIQWLRDQLQIITTSDHSEKMALKAKSSAGVFVIPALTGLGAPFWKPNARGAIVGLTRGSSRAEISRASLEALSFQNKALIDAMIKDLPNLKSDWRVDGGAVKNNLLMQIQATALNQSIVRPKNLEATGTGIALLAAYSANALTLNEIQNIWEQDKIFKAEKNKTKELTAIYKKWLSLVEEA